MVPALVVLAAATVLELPRSYCYRTLADVSCYLAPMPADAARFVGSYTVDPAALHPKPSPEEGLCGQAGPRELRGEPHAPCLRARPED
mgnify:CR=1 FL=1